LLGSVVICVAAAIGCWLQTSVVGWLVNLAALAILMLLTLAYARPGLHLLPRPFPKVYPVCGALGALSVVRVGSLGWPHVSSTAMGAIVFTGVLVVYVVAGLREPGTEADEMRLSFPFRSGRWAVTIGGVRAFNHHLHVPGQAGALDLVALRIDGARASGVCPARLEDYLAYDVEVVSPCAGVVADVVDHQPEHPPGWIRRGSARANQVVIDAEGSVVTLTHLRPGSIRVVPGERVVPGTPIGRVGNSGRSAEPHLHLHAERDGRPLRLRFTDLPKARLRPGRVILSRI